MTDLLPIPPSVEQLIYQAVPDDTMQDISTEWMIDILRTEAETPTDPKTGLLWARQYLESESFRTWLMHDQGTLFHEDNPVFKDMRPPIQRERMDMVGIFIDGDEWKHINITKGHEAGDEAIIGLGENLQRLFRPDDRVLRFGGDEFVAILKNVPRHLVDELGKVIQARLNGFALEVNGDEIHKSATIGHASCPMTAFDEPEGYKLALETLALAEKEMLDAKQVRYDR